MRFPIRFKMFDLNHQVGIRIGRKAIRIKNPLNFYIDWKWKRDH